jgi:membrane protease YdiL (CAAX protease family)
MKVRSFVLAFAIFCSLCPFSYYHTDNGSAFLFLEHPSEALIYVPFAVVFWGIYFGIKQKLRTG